MKWHTQNRWGRWKLLTLRNINIRREQQKRANVSAQFSYVGEFTKWKIIRKEIFSVPCQFATDEEETIRLSYWIWNMNYMPGTIRNVLYTFNNPSRAVLSFSGQVPKLAQLKSGRAGNHIGFASGPTFSSPVLSCLESQMLDSTGCLIKWQDIHGKQYTTEA